ncbi:PilZ domain-containing protein [Tsuneonella mangrovi]|uniref:PilZ domain-containing protein n=1 Tax=Tsuneonella mangrovi TaxID=1982042 RepID=UPI001470D7FF|nr:PilZ domain-containing protein [Tsuneonella mangrovi]
MAFFQTNRLADQADRRAVRRYSVDRAARIKLAGGDRFGRLTDLSEAGARFDGQNPPVEGASCLLCWDGYEYFAKVIWASQASCGVRFERDIPMEVVEATIEAVEFQDGPVAHFGNIPLGQKRSRRSSLVSED